MARARLHKVMADAGIGSRRGSEDLIRAGRVKVDGRPAILGEKVDPDMQRVQVDGKPLPAVARVRSYWALNKPAGVVSTVKDRHAGRTVMELLPADARQARLYPVGRLDEESEGLLLFTDDGTWAELLLHPRHGVEREYMVGLDRSVTKVQRTALRSGVELEEGSAHLDRLEDATPAQVRNLLDLLEPPHAELRWYRVVLAQGWKRQIRRMFESVGAPVRRLVRVRVGTFKLTDLHSGETRQLTHQEVTQLASRARSDSGSTRVRATSPSPHGGDSPPEI
ncbi:MAG: pseudouridine synthase, partial [Candidatus Limnocylindrales bacterium]